MKKICEGSGTETTAISKHKLVGLCPICRQPVRLVQLTSKLEVHYEV